MKKESRRTKSFPRDAVKTRMRIMQAARLHFAHESFDHVSVRAIASDAGVDAALINRYFGSKENLFIEVITGVFNADVLLQGDVSELASRFTNLLTSEADEVEWREQFDPLLLLLRSAGDPQASMVVSQVFQREFILTLADKLKGNNSVLRAGLIASYIIGLATTRFVLKSLNFSDSDRHTVSNLLNQAFQVTLN